MKRTKLIINESYWDLFANKTFLEQEFFSLNSLDNLNNLSISEITRLLALSLKEKDSNKTSKYGIEIKTNGSSRSARIPLARFSSKSQTIWKVVKSLREMEKGILDLQDLEYHLEHSLGERKFSIPKKILVIIDYKSEKMNETETFKYIERKSSDTNIICISLDFLCKYLYSNEIVDLEEIILNKKAVYIKV